MKTSLRTFFTGICNPQTILSKPFFSRNFFVLLMTAFSIVGVNSTVKAQLNVITSPPAFGSVCLGTTSSEQSFTITGSYLTPNADVTVAALSGYKYSTVPGGPYFASLTLPQSSGNITQDIYILFSPTAIQSYNGNVVIGGGGAFPFNLAITGNGAGASISSVTGSTPLCIGGTTTYVANSVTLGGGTGAWSSSNNAVATVDASGLVTAVSAGTCNIIYTITGGCNGTASAQQSVTITPNASITSVTGSTPLCIGGTTTYLANSVVLGGGIGAWSSSNTAIATVNASGLVTAVSAGSCNIIYTISGGCSGTKTAQQSITITPNASVSSVTGSTPLCIGGTATYLANSVVLGGGTGAWSSNNTAIATVNASGLVTAVSAGTCNIIYTITGGCNGTASAQQSITITPNASISSVTGSTPLCIGGTATYLANSVVLGGGTGAWSSDNTGIATVNASGLVTAVSAGTCNIIYTITGGCNGTASAQQSITITPNASITSVTGSTPLCIGGTTTYLANSVVLGGGTGAWSSSNTAIATVNASGLVTAVSAGSCNIIYTISGGCSGTKTAQQSITITPNASVSSVTGSTPLCIGGTTTYLANSVVLGGGTGAWSSSNIAIATVNASGLVTAVSAGTCNIIYTITGGCNGTTSAQQSITVNAIPTITGTTPAAICGTGTATLGATASAGTINWYNVSSGGSSLGTGTSFVTPSISSTTTYYVDATNNGCTTGTRMAVIATVNPMPTITGTTSATICGTGTATLGATASAGTINWYAASTGGSSLGTGTSFVTSSISSSKTYYVDATNNGCTTGTRTAVTATVNPVPNVSINPTFTSGFVKKNTGSTVFYTFTVTNIGLVSDYFDLTGISLPDPNTVIMDIAFQTTGGTAITSTPIIAAGGTYTFQVKLTVNGNAPKIYNHTLITATSHLCSISNVSANIYTYEYNGSQPPASSAAQLGIAKTASVATATVGVAFTYTITAVNNSTSTAATNVLISDQVPASLTITDAAGGTVSSNTITWDVGTLDKIGGAVNTVQKIITVVPSCSSVPSVTNTANIFSSPSDNGLGIYTASVTTAVTDNIPPVANCKPATVLIDASGVATVTAAMIDNGSTDNCTIQTYAVSPSVFSCSNIGANTVTLTVTDKSGNSSSCTTTVTVAYGTGVKGTWTGKGNTDWFNCQNWSGGVVPDASTDVTIPVVAGNIYPLISSSTGTVRNITIASTASVIINGTGKLQIGGAIINSGTLNASAGTIEFNGSGAQTISGSMFTGSTINNLTISNTNIANSLTVSSGSTNTLNIAGVLSFGNVSGATLNTGDNIVLTSTATGTASVADITNGGTRSGNSFNGNVTVERYFPKLRAWRLITSPLSGTGTIFNTWQNGGANVPGKGTLITGLVTGNGLDTGPFPNSSLKIGSAFTPVSNTNVALSNATGPAANLGYFIFVRGDRDPQNFIVPHMNNTTLSSKGKLQTGDQVFTATATAGAYTLIGNPYASPVDFSKLNRLNLNNRFYVWDPRLNSEQGGYVVVQDMANTGTYTATPTTTQPNATSQTKYIQSSQAFFVDGTGGGPTASLTFKESYKAPSATNNLNIFRPMNPARLQSLVSNLYLRNDNGDNVLADGNLVQFDDSFNAGVDMMDAVKFGNVLETYGVLSGAANLAVNFRPTISNKDTIFYKFAKARQLKYQFEFVATNLDRENLAGFVEDKFLNKLTPLNMNSTTKVDFEVNANAASAATDRFKIVFNPSAIFANLTATVLNSDNAVQWSLPNEYNIKEYEIEHSTNGVNFTKISTVVSSGNSANPVAYNWLHVAPALGYHYYRIRSVSNNGVTGYSNVVNVKLNKSTPAIYVFPNPVTENFMQLQMNGMPKGDYTITLFNSQGQAVISDKISHLAGTSTEKIVPDHKLVPGIYELKVTAPDKKVTVIKVIVN